MNLDWLQQPKLEPRVFEEREFLEIAEDFSNPCEIFREAISNTFDAGATEIRISLSVIRKGSRDILRIEICDNGCGMGREELQAFFDLGNSTSRDNPEAIGEKGHGTKIYYKSAHIEVLTTRNGTQLRAEVQAPYDALANGSKPAITISARSGDTNGTRITIDDYNHSIRDKFTRAYLRDYILWFTKFGSVEREFGKHISDGVTLTLKGVDQQTPEVLCFGHVLPPESKNLNKLLDDYRHEAPDHFVKRWHQTGTLRNFPDIKWEAVFYLEGDSAKRACNPMIRGKGRTLQTGMYSVQERYGLWLCKDYIPVQRTNEWITVKGSEYTRFHAFLNCQDFRLTANRGSVLNTPPAVLEDIQHALSDYFRNQIVGSSEYSDLDWLDGQAAAFVNQERDEKDFEKRLKRLPKRRVGVYRNIEIVEPENEIGVVAAVIAITVVDPKAFPFRILDYTTYRGYDALATLSRDDLPLDRLSKGYIEFKFCLKRSFDHLFKHLAAIVCWEANVTDGEEVTDVGDNRRTFCVVPGDEDKSERTKYWLDDSRARSRIEVFVLKDYLAEQLSLRFDYRS